jgi:hypothetical protein
VNKGGVNHAPSQKLVVPCEKKRRPSKKGPHPRHTFMWVSSRLIKDGTASAVAGGYQYYIGAWTIKYSKKEIPEGKK